MAASLTRKGRETLLKNTNRIAALAANETGFANSAVALILLHDTTVVTDNPTVDAVGAIASGNDFIEVATGNGYTTGGITTGAADWTFDAPTGKITLDNQVWTAAGGAISNVAGAIAVDEAGVVLAYWDRASVNVADGQTITAAALSIAIS